MENRRIVFTKPNTAELLPWPLTDPKAGEVQVAMEISSISSGTERANLIGELNISILHCYSEAIFPRYVGYSSAGVVLRAGEGVTGLKPGDRVAMFQSVHQQIINMPQEKCILLPEGVSPEEGALFYITSFPLAAIRKCRLELGESVLVMGQGLLGMLAVRLLRAAGAMPVIAADPIPEKRALALTLGADYALDPFAADFAQQVKKITGGGAKVAIEVTGSGKALDNALDCMAPMGRVALLGCTRNSDFSIDYYHKVHGPGITLVGAHNNARPKQDSTQGYWTQRDDLNAILSLLIGGRLSLKDMIQETHSPEEAPEVYSRLATERGFPVVQFDWRLLK